MSFFDKAKRKGAPDQSVDSVGRSAGLSGRNREWLRESRDKVVISWLERRESIQLSRSPGDLTSRKYRTLRNRVRSSDATKQTSELTGSVIFVPPESLNGFNQQKSSISSKCSIAMFEEKVDASRCNILYLSRCDKIMRKREREGERKGTDGWSRRFALSRQRGMRRLTTWHREDPVKVAPSGRASRISRDYVSVGLSSWGCSKKKDRYSALIPDR